MLAFLIIIFYKSSEWFGIKNISKSYFFIVSYDQIIYVKLSESYDIKTTSKGRKKIIRNEFKSKSIYNFIIMMDKQSKKYPNLKKIEFYTHTQFSFFMFFLESHNTFVSKVIVLDICWYMIHFSIIIIVSYEKLRCFAFLAVIIYLINND